MSTENERLRSYVEQMQEDNTTRRKEYEKLVLDYQKKIILKEDENKMLKQDNSSLLMYIEKLNVGKEPVKQDSYYIEGFDSLNHLISSSVAKAFKSKPTRDLSLESANHIHNVLTRLAGRTPGPMGGQSISKIFKDSPKRTALVRHIIARVLWRYIFSPLAFGLQDNVETNLSAVVKYLYFSGT